MGPSFGRTGLPISPMSAWVAASADLSAQRVLLSPVRMWEGLFDGKARNSFRFGHGILQMDPTKSHGACSQLDVRYAHHSSLPAGIVQACIALSLRLGEELAMLIFQWVAFVGAGIAVRHRFHLHLDPITNHFPERWQKSTYLMGSAAVPIEAYLLIHAGIVVMDTVKSTTLSIMHFPRAYVCLAIPYALVICFCTNTIARFTKASTRSTL